MTLWYNLRFNTLYKYSLNYSFLWSSLVKSSSRTHSVFAFLSLHKFIHDIYRLFPIVSQYLTKSWLLLHFCLLNGKIPSKIYIAIWRALYQTNILPSYRLFILFSVVNMLIDNIICLRMHNILFGKESLFFFE